MSEDRRGAFRRNAFTNGTVETLDGEAECLVWDVTDTGALIELDGPGTIPDRIRVRLTQEGEWRNAAVAWRQANRAGITFEA